MTSTAKPRNAEVLLPHPNSGNLAAPFLYSSSLNEVLNAFAIANPETSKSSDSSNKAIALLMSLSSSPAVVVTVSEP